MNVAKLGASNLFAFTFQIGDLSGDQLQRAGRVGQFKDNRLMGIARPAATFGYDFKGLRQQRVPGKDGDAFPKDFVAGELAPAVIVIVHGG